MYDIEGGLVLATRTNQESSKEHVVSRSSIDIVVMKRRTETHKDTDNFSVNV
jgi:hypothetical protein